MRFRTFAPADGVVAAMLLLILIVVTVRGPVTVLEEESGFGVRSDVAAQASLPIEGPLSVEKRRVNLNRSTVQRLATLPGIGPTLAEAIVRFRETHGPFERLSDLQKVPGIGRNRMKRILPHLTLGEEGAWSTK